MQIPKEKILEPPRARGDQDKANQAEGGCPIRWTPTDMPACCRSSASTRATS